MSEPSSWQVREGGSWKQRAVAAANTTSTHRAASCRITWRSGQARGGRERAAVRRCTPGSVFEVLTEDEVQYRILCMSREADRYGQAYKCATTKSSPDDMGIHQRSAAHLGVVPPDDMQCSEQQGQAEV